MANDICHIEFHGKDLKVSAEFYSKVFDWKMTPVEDEYTLFNPAEGIGGGLSKGGGEDCTGQETIAYIHVDDIEAKLREIEAAGGTVIVQKTMISEEYGYIGLFKDPSGVTVGLWAKG